MSTLSPKLICRSENNPRLLVTTRVKRNCNKLLTAVNKSGVAEVEEMEMELTVNLDKIQQYNSEMQQKMDNVYEYRPEKGLYYHYISEDIIVGSQPRTSDDIDKIVVNEGISTILNLQEDRDLANWGVNFHTLKSRAEQHGGRIFRVPATDFDEHSLRAKLPEAVAALQKGRQYGKVYVHCTAGLGRSPAVAIAALYWFSNMQLDQAYSYLTSIRPCGPKRDAIRGATYDLLSNRHWDGFKYEPPHAFAELNAADRRMLWERLPI